MGTYIKLYREILDNPRLSSDNNAYLMFTKLLLKVDRHTGTYITGRKKLATLCNLKETTAWMTLKRLNDDNMINMLSDKHKTKITICNWDEYQSRGDRYDDRSSVDLMTKKRGFDDTKQELKKKNKENKKKVLSPLDDAIDEFILHRKQMKRPMTEKAIELLHQKLEKMYPGNPENQIATLYQSIENGWQGVFELRNPLAISSESAGEHNRKVLEKLGYEHVN